MFAALLPGLRDLRPPLASGAAWLACFWLWWGRHLPASGEAEGLLADVYRLAEHAGSVAVAGAATFLAYLVGELWDMLRGTSAIDQVRGKLRRNYGIMRFTAWGMSSHGRGFEQMVNDLTTEDGHFRELLPKLGARRPNTDKLTNEDKVDVIEALIRDSARSWIMLVDSGPELREEADRRFAEYRFRLLLALPLALCVASIMVIQIGSWLGVAIGVPLGVAIWFGLSLAAWFANWASLSVLLSAVDVGKIPAPNLGRVAIEKFGPVEEHNDGTNTVG